MMVDDRTLLQTIAAGGPDSRRALAELFGRHRKPLLSFLRSRGIAPDRAEDVVQDVFFKVVQEAAGFRGGSQVSTWLYAIALRLGIDAHRKSAREPTLDDDGWAAWEAVPEHQNRDDPGDAVDRLRFESCCEHHLKRFANAHPAMADALHKFYELGWTSAQLSQVLNRSDAATRKFLQKCRETLTSFLQPCADLAKATTRT